MQQHQNHSRSSSGRRRSTIPTQRCTNKQESSHTNLRQKGEQRMRSQSKANFMTTKNAQIKIKCIDLIQFSENARIFKLHFCYCFFFFQQYFLFALLILCLSICCLLSRAVSIITTGDSRNSITISQPKQQRSHIYSITTTSDSRANSTFGHCLDRGTVAAADASAAAKVSQSILVPSGVFNLLVQRLQPLTH